MKTFFGMRLYKYQLTLKSQNKVAETPQKKIFKGKCWAHNEDEARDLVFEYHERDLGTFGIYHEITIEDISEKPRIEDDFCVFWADE